MPLPRPRGCAPGPDATTAWQETRLRDLEAREQDNAPRYPDTTRGLEVAADHPEGTLEEDVPVYETTQSAQDAQKGVSKMRARCNAERRQRRGGFFGDMLLATLH